jgi:predicted metal-dependent phosphoesterase TrpH
MKIDLHNHTFYSDGKFSPEELVLRAKRNGVDVFALTDHDSVFGDDEIVKIGEKHGIKVIKGMELSTYYKGEAIHIVGLFKNNIVPKPLLDFSNDFLKKRKDRAIKMMEKIQEIYGLKMNIDELIENSKVITRANMLFHLMKYNNLSREEAVPYISNKSKAYIPSTKMSVADGLKLLRESDTVVILAHPCLYPEEYLDEILPLGFDGIEVKYPSPKNDEKKMRKYQEKYHLLASAGSDCHGEGEGIVGDHGDIGTSTLTEEEFLPIKKLLNL